MGSAPRAFRDGSAHDRSEHTDVEGGSDVIGTHGVGEIGAHHDVDEIVLFSRALPRRGALAPAAPQRPDLDGALHAQACSA